MNVQVTPSRSVLGFEHFRASGAELNALLTSSHLILTITLCERLAEGSPLLKSGSELEHLHVVGKTRVMILDLKVASVRFPNTQGPTHSSLVSTHRCSSSTPSPAHSPSGSRYQIHLQWHCRRTRHWWRCLPPPRSWCHSQMTLRLLSASSMWWVSGGADNPMISWRPQTSSNPLSPHLSEYSSPLGPGDQI